MLLNWLRGRLQDGGRLRVCHRLRLFKLVLAAGDASGVDAEARHGRVAHRGLTEEIGRSCSGNLWLRLSPRLGGWVRVHAHRTCKAVVCETVIEGRLLRETRAVGWLLGNWLLHVAVRGDPPSRLDVVRLRLHYGWLHHGLLHLRRLLRRLLWLHLRRLLRRLLKLHHRWLHHGQLLLRRLLTRWNPIGCGVRLLHLRLARVGRRLLVHLMHH